MIRRHGRLLATAFLALAALVLVALGAQLLRWERQISRDDVVFQATPLRPDLWRSAPFPQLDPSRAILGIDDDLAFRRALQLFWRAKPRSIDYRPLLQAYIAQAQGALTRIADSSSSAERRSAAFNLMGVLQFSQTLPSSDEAARNATIREGVGDFRNALELDATNDDAKLNLELAARLYREELTGPPISGGPSGGANNGSAGGAGAIGGGY